MDEKDSDLDLVRLVVEENSSDAMKQLFKKYSPMVENLMNQFYIRTFQRDDWRQEALIVCHETCFRFKGGKGSRFGSFYKLRLANHYRSLVRKEMAKKRKLDRVSLPLDKMPLDYEKNMPSKNYPFTDAVKVMGYVGGRQKVNFNEKLVDWQEFANTLNDLEFDVLLMLVGEKTMSEVRHKYCKNKQQLLRIQAACKNKLTQYLS